MYSEMVTFAFLWVFLIGVASARHSDAVSFLVIGDWGKNTVPLSERHSVVPRHLRADNNGRHLAKKPRQTEQLEIAAAMHKYVRHQEDPLDYIVSVGDNFYMKGVTSIHDPKWKVMWRDVYLNPGSALMVPWHPVLGNHDYGFGRAGIAVQVERTRGTDDDQVYW